MNYRDDLADLRWAEAALLRVLRRMDFNRKRKPRPARADRPRCGARTRKGEPCKAPVVWARGEKPRARCRMHGGLSTGPRTVEGRERIAESNRRRAAVRRAALRPRVD